MKANAHLRRPGYDGPGAIALALGLFLAATPAAADLFTVGPGGTHATVQGAVDAALAAPGVDNIRIATGTYVENVTIEDDGFAVHELVISGGWQSPAFTSHVDNPALTIIDGGGVGQTLYLNLIGVKMEISQLTITGGQTVPGRGGAGIGVFMFDMPNRVRLVRVRVTDNAGSGLGGSPGALTTLEIAESTFSGNEGSGASLVGAANITVFTDLRFDIHDSEFEDNGQGLTLVLREGTRARVLNNRFLRNSGSGAEFRVEEDLSGFEARRNQFLDNQVNADDPSAPQVLISTSDPIHHVVFSDNLIARGHGDGLLVRSNSKPYLTNLTVTGNAGAGLRFEGPPEWTPFLNNTISWDNGEDLVSSAAIDGDHNLIGVDPEFRVPGRVYSVRPASPAIDAGDDRPPGDLGDFDIDLRPRIQGPAVDIGAYETSGGGGGPGGPQACTITSAGPPAQFPFGGSWFGAPSRFCFCARLPAEFRCRLLVPDFFLTWTLPRGISPGAEVLFSGLTIPLDPEVLGARLVPHNFAGLDLKQGGLYDAGSLRAGTRISKSAEPGVGTPIPFRAILSAPLKPGPFDASFFLGHSDEKTGETFGIRVSIPLEVID